MSLVDESEKIGKPKATDYIIGVVLLVLFVVVTVVVVKKLKKSK
jgi:hypothetical protein